MKLALPKAIPHFWGQMALLTVALTPAWAQNYAVTDLGALGGTNSSAYGINNHGVIVGDAMLPDGRTHAFAFTNGLMMDLGALGGTNSRAYGINNQGHIVGMADLTNGMHHGFWDANGSNGFTMMDLGTLGGTNSLAYAINDHDTIAGQADLPAGLSHAFIWTNSSAGMMDIDSIDLSSSAGYGMNSSNQVAGFAHFGGVMSAFTTAAGTMGGGMSSMGTMGGGSSVAYGLSDGGMAVGAATMSNGGLHAFYSSSGGMMGGVKLSDLGTLGGTNSQAYCINAFTNIVGTADTTNGMPHAFLFAGGMMHDLNNLIPTNSGWTLMEARGINDTNQIVGTGLMDGQMHAFLLTPVSAPVQISVAPTNLMLGAGATVPMNVAMSTGDTLRYQWMLNGRDLPGQTNATLMLSAMQPAMTGEYNVVVSNPSGMVADLHAGVAMLTIQRPAGATPSLMLYGPMNGHYRVDQTTVLGDGGTWSTMTNFSLATNMFQVMINNHSAMQFFRAVPLP